MKKVFILRHALADHHHDDIRRPLSLAGVEQSFQLRQFIADQSIRPELILCSPATRTRQTLSPLLSLWSDVRVDYLDELYLGDAGQLYHILERRMIDDQVMLIGHNPGVHQLVLDLVGQDNGQGDMQQIWQLQQGFAPCTLAGISFAEQIQHKAGTLEILQEFRP